MASEDRCMTFNVSTPYSWFTELQEQGLEVQ
jgi:hypothetical protein